jgi:hypothetical protein
MTTTATRTEANSLNYKVRVEDLHGLICIKYFLVHSREISYLARAELRYTEVGLPWIFRDVRYTLGTGPYMCMHAITYVLYKVHMYLHTDAQVCMYMH